MSTPVSPLAALAFLLGGGVAGFVAAVAMDVPMNRQPEGWTPAWLAAATVRRTTPDAIPFREATVAHHGAGILAGASYGLLTLLLGLAAPWPAFAGVSLVGHLAAVGVVTLFIYGFFAHFVLPRVGGQVYEERATAVRGQWLRSALTFAVAMAVAGPLLLVLFSAAFGLR